MKGTLMKSVPLLTGIACLVVVAASQAFASAEDQIDSALTVSKAWVAQIDAGNYDESYAFGCDAMHDKVPQDRWTLLLKTFQALYGPMVSRTQISHVYKPNGYEGTEGEFLIITYQSSFKKLDDATEVVVLKWDDGKWRGAGYSAGPRPTPDDGTDTTVSPGATETHTEPHVKPQPQ
jgi:hypothetical protein